VSVRYVRRTPLPMWDQRLAYALAQGTTPHQWRTRLGAPRCVRCGEAQGVEVGEIRMISAVGAPKGVGACTRCHLPILEALATLTPHAPFKAGPAPVRAPPGGPPPSVPQGAEPSREIDGQT